jgi:hypothetical protein
MEKYVAQVITAFTHFVERVIDSRTSVRHLNMVSKS